MDDREFDDVMTRARAGDEAATAALLSAFEADVRMMVRLRLPRLLRSQFDSMDFVQAVWQSVFAGAAKDADFTSPGHFRGFLAGVARNKVYEQYRRGTKTRKYDLSREEPLFVRRGNREAPRMLESSDPSPSQKIQAEECYDQIVAGRSPAEAEVLALRRQGLTFEEIATRTGLSERSARRVIEDARRRVRD